MSCNSIFPTGHIPAPAQEIAARFCMENVNSPEYEKIKELDAFNAHDELLIRRNIDDRDRGKPNVPNCYEVTTRTGQPIFKVVQTLDTLPNERPSSSKPFKLSIFDMRSGNELVKLVAKQGADSVVVYARQKHMEYHGIGKILRIRQGNRIRGPDYNVRGSSGKVVFKVNGGCCFFYKKATFNIATSDNSQQFGKICKEAEDEEKRYHRRADMAIDDVVYKIRFPIDISMVSKALILSTTLVMDYDYFDCGAKEARTDFILMSAGLAFVTFVVLLVLVVITVSISKKFAYLSRFNSNGTTSNGLDQQFELIEDTTTQPSDDSLIK